MANNKKADPRSVSLGIRIRPAIKERLDILCEVNQRSIPDLFEILVNTHYDDLLMDENTRINP